MKIAIIGAGVSGLVAAYRLHHRHQVTVFEANDYPGGHAQTVRVDVDGESFDLDTGFMVFNNWTYPEFNRLLDTLQVKSRATTMSFSVRDEQSGLEYNGSSLNALFAQRGNLLRRKFYRMLVDILRFNQLAKSTAQDLSDKTTVQEFVRQHRLSQAFTDFYLLPMGAAIWSCPPGKFAEFPVRFIAEFYRNHGLLNLRSRPTWSVVAGGSRVYVDALTREFRDHIRLDCPIANVHRMTDYVVIKPLHGPAEPYDHVIFACHSDQALKILADGATSKEREILSAFPYQKNLAVLHTDTSLLPQNRRAWACWNYRLRTGERNTAANVTYNLNLLQGIAARRTFCVTLNDDSTINPQLILKKIEYHHPVFTTERASAQARHSELINSNRTSFCGAYWGNGFHEDGVVSGLKVASSLETASSRVSLSMIPAGRQA